MAGLFHLIITILITAFSTPTASSSDLKSCTASYTNCTFYHCINDNYRCGPNGYLRSVGYPICVAFARAASQFTPAGRRWIVGSRYCLQEALVPDATNTTESCETLTKHAFNSHPACYVEYGFCTLPPSDKAKFAKIVAPGVAKYPAESAKEVAKLQEMCAQSGS